MSIPNYPKIETVDGEIKHDPDDDAAYMLEVVHYLCDEVASMRNSDNLTNDEIKATIDASEHLARLRGQLEERAQEEAIEDIPFEKINENLDSIMSSTVLIQHKLADVQQKIDRVGWPETNPYDIAGEQEHAAKDVHQDIARLQREIEEDDYENLWREGLWLAEVMNGDNLLNHTITPTKLSDETIVSVERLKHIRDGKYWPRGDELPSILKYLHHCGHIGDQAARDILDQNGCVPNPQFLRSD